MHRKNHFIAFALAAITLALYWPVRGFDLVYWDDPQMLADCPQIAAGLTWASVKWAWTGVVIANWHPVTNLSFLIVSQFFGIAPGAHHLTNAFIHAANAALLFWLLLHLTGARWRSAAVAAIFAWHPLRVESVAWIVERKDVLCAFFFLLTLLAWTKRVTTEELSVKSGHQFFRLATRHSPLFFFALALLSKPMAVTLPFVLLLLDVWPLGRVEKYKLKVAGPGRPSAQPSISHFQLLAEKWPFFALMFLFCLVTYWIQRDYAAMTPWEKLGLAPRLHNVVASYTAYLAQLFWPLNLAAIYPYPKSFDPLPTALKAALLLAISALCIGQIKKRPQFVFGWFWYLGTALPVIGLVQVGEQAMADRYTYLPLIGPVIALVWTAAEFFSGGRNLKIVLTTASVSILSALLFLSAHQLQFWRNTTTLFSHNVEVTPENGSAHFTLGLGYEHAGDTNRALVSYRVAKELSPADAQIRHCLASLLAKQNQLAAAENEYQQLIALNEKDFSVHAALAGVFAAEGRAEESLAQLNEAARWNPDSTEVLNNLAWQLAASPDKKIRDGAKAVVLAQRACELTKFSKTMFIGTLAAALAEAGRFDEAIATAQRACDLAVKNGETDLLQRNRELLEHYRAHKTARQE